MSKKNILYFLLIFSCCAMDEKGWEPRKENSIANEEQAKTLKSDAEERKTKAEDKLKETSLSAEERTNWDLKKNKALYDAALADSFIAKSEEDKALNRGDFDAAQTATQEKNQAEKLKTDALNTIQRLSTTLSTIMEKQVDSKPLNVINLVPDQLSTVIALDPSDNSVNKITTLSNIVDKGINTQKKALDALKSDSGRLGMITTMRSSLDKVRLSIDAQAKNLEEKGMQNSQLYKELKQFNRRLLVQQTDIDTKGARAIISQEDKQPGFWKRLAQKFSSWFENSFLKFRQTKLKNPETPLTSLLREMKSMENTLESVMQLNNNTQSFLTYAQVLADALANETNPQFISKMIQQAEGMISSSENFAQRFVQSDRDIIDKSVNMSFNDLIGTIAGYKERRKKPDQLLFDTFVDRYRTEFKAQDDERYTGKKFGPHEGYEILGLPRTASLEEIESKVHELGRSKSKTGVLDPSELLVDHIGNILRNPETKQNYDTFLKDVDTLHAYKEMEGKDPFDVNLRPENVQNYLANNSGVRALQLSQQDEELFTPVEEQINRVQTYAFKDVLRDALGKEGIPPLLQNVNDIRARLADAIEAAQTKLKKSNEPPV